jgi:hypothetical protein
MRALSDCSLFRVRRCSSCSCGVVGVQSKDLAHTQKGVSMGFAAIYGKHPQVDPFSNVCVCVCV